MKMKKVKQLSPKEWWICEDEYCGNPLAKIVEGKIGFPEVIQILGNNGQQFIVRPQYAKLYCIKCGKQNDIIAGELLSKEWRANFDQMEKDTGEKYSEDDNFFDSQYLRNLLLGQLTAIQKKVFQFMQENPDGEWTIKDLAKKLQITEDTAHEVRGDVYKWQAAVKIGEISKHIKRYHLKNEKGLDRKS